MSENSNGRHGGLYVVAGAVIAALGVLAYFVMAGEENAAASKRAREMKIEAPGGAGTKAPQ